MTSTAVCNYSGASWEENSAGQNSCEMYAALQGICDSSFTVGVALPNDPPYAPPQNACGCNTVAYNLMAGCGWCQNNIYTSWWMTYAEWQGNCTTGTVTFSTPISASVNTAPLNLPVWATLVPDLTTWDPSQASLAAIAATPSLTQTGSTTANGQSTSSRASSTSNRFSFNSNSGFFTFTGPLSGGDDDFNTTANNAGKAAGIAVGVILGIYALIAIIVAVVYFKRQSDRKAWYGPMAQYYAAQRGAGGAGGAQPAFYNPNQPYDPAKTPATTGSGNGAYAYQPPPPEATPYNYVEQHQTGYSGNSNPNPSVYGGYQPPASTAPSNAPYSIPSSGTPANTTSMYGAPPAGPPPGAGGAMGYRGHAEV